MERVGGVDLGLVGGVLEGGRDVAVFGIGIGNRAGAWSLWVWRPIWRLDCDVDLRTCLMWGQVVWWEKCDLNWVSWWGVCGGDLL